MDALSVAAAAAKAYAGHLREVLGADGASCQLYGPNPSVHLFFDDRNLRYDFIGRCDKLDTLRNGDTGETFSRFARKIDGVEFFVLEKRQ